MSICLFQSFCPVFLFTFHFCAMLSAVISLTSNVLLAGNKLQKLVMCGLSFS